MNHSIRTSADKLAYCGAYVRRNMTNEEKLRLVQSVYSNPKRLRIAQFIFSNKQCTAEQIIEATGYNKTTVSQIITEMKEVGVVRSEQSLIDGRLYYLSLTDTGKKLVRL